MYRIRVPELHPIPLPIPPRPCLSCPPIGVSPGILIQPPDVLVPQLGY